MIFKAAVIILAVLGLVFTGVYIFRKLSVKSKIERKELEGIILDKQKTLEVIEDEIKNNPKIKSNNISDLINRLP